MAWILFMCSLIYCMQADIGGVPIQDFDQKTNQSETKTAVFSYDEDGYLIKNPYRPLKAEEVRL